MINDKPSFAFLEIFARHGPKLESREASNAPGTKNEGLFFSLGDPTNPVGEQVEIFLGRHGRIMMPESRGENTPLPKLVHPNANLWSFDFPAQGGVAFMSARKIRSGLATSGPAVPTGNGPFEFCLTVA